MRALKCSKKKTFGLHENMPKSWKYSFAGFLVFISLILMTAGFVLTLAGWVAPLNRKTVAYVRLIAPFIILVGLLLLITSCCICAYYQNRCSSCCYEKCFSTSNKINYSTYDGDTGDITTNLYMQKAPCEMKEILIDKANQGDVQQCSIEKDDNYRNLNKSHNNSIHKIPKRHNKEHSGIVSFDFSNAGSNCSKIVCTQAIPNDYNTVNTIKENDDNYISNRTSQFRSNTSSRGVMNSEMINKAINLPQRNFDISRSERQRPLDQVSTETIKYTSSDSCINTSLISITDSTISDKDSDTISSMSKSSSQINNNERNVSFLSPVTNDEIHPEKINNQYSEIPHRNFNRQVSFPPSVCLHQCLTPKTAHRNLSNEKKYFSHTSSLFPHSYRFNDQILMCGRPYIQSRHDNSDNHCLTDLRESHNPTDRRGELNTIDSSY